MKIQLVNENPSAAIDERFRLIEKVISFDPETRRLIAEIPETVLVELFEKDDEDAPAFGAAIDYDSGDEGPVINLLNEENPLNTLKYFLFELCNAANPEMRTLSISRLDYIRNCLLEGMTPSEIAKQYAEACEAAEYQSAKRYLAVLRSILNHIDDLDINVTQKMLHALNDEIKRLEVIDPTRKVIKFSKKLKLDSHYQYFFHTMLVQAEAVQQMLYEEEEIFALQQLNYLMSFQTAIIKFYENPEMFMLIIDEYSLCNDEVQAIMDERDVEALQALIESLETFEVIS